MAIVPRLPLWLILVVPPREVISLERDQPKQRLDLLVYRLHDAPAEQLRAATRPPSGLQLFWRDGKHLLLARGSTPLADLEPLVTDLRLQMLGP